MLLCLRGRVVNLASVEDPPEFAVSNQRSVRPSYADIYCFVTSNELPVSIYRVSVFAGPYLSWSFPFQR